MEKTITLTLIVPDGQTTTCTCDALRFTIPDGYGKGKNKHSGGSIGIHPGHTDALMAVAAGDVTAALAGQTVLRAAIGDGLAMVSADAVTILTDRITTPAADHASANA